MTTTCGHDIFHSKRVRSTDIRRREGGVREILLVTVTRCRLVAPVCVCVYLTRSSPNSCLRDSTLLDEHREFPSFTDSRNAPFSFSMLKLRTPPPSLFPGISVFRTRIFVKQLVYNHSFSKLFVRFLFFDLKEYETPSVFCF